MGNKGIKGSMGDDSMFRRPSSKMDSTSNKSTSSKTQQSSSTDIVVRDTLQSTASEAIVDPIAKKLVKIGQSTDVASKFHRDNLLEDFVDLKFDRQDIPIKLIYGEPTGNKIFQAIASKILRKEHGALHMAVQVGPLVLHWVNCSLVQISAAKSNKADLALELGSINMENNVLAENTQIKKLLDKIAEYNLTREYDISACNCQIFVKEILTLLNVNSDAIFSLRGNREEMSQHFDLAPDKKLILGLYTPNEYAEYLKSNGTHPPNPFRSHEELDAILNTFMSNHPEMKGKTKYEKLEIFQGKYPAEYYILKVYCRYVLIY
jgi:hypothetical protein